MMRKSHNAHVKAYSKRALIQNETTNVIEFNSGRLMFLCSLSFIFIIVLIYRLVNLQVIENGQLQYQGAQRTHRTVEVNAQRGMILDRQGEPLAVSTQVVSLWMNPTQVNFADPNWNKLAAFLNTDVQSVFSKIMDKQNKQFVYLKRHIAPYIGNKIADLKLAGLYVKPEFRRFYPTAEVSAHVLGTTNIDGKGIQGLELAFDSELAQISGYQQILKDGFGSRVEELNPNTMAKSGQDVQLSIDSRIQYAAYRELLTAVQKHQAIGGTAVVLNCRTGEVLAMVNQPSYNPNGHFSKVDESFRNRAVTDQFEPGSVLKAFSATNILASGKFDPFSVVDTHPGWMRLAGHVVKDIRNYGSINLTRVIQKSSNVGISKLTLELPPESLVNTLSKLGFGQKTESGFPGESAGILSSKVTQNPFMLATLSFGYGMTVTPIQLAKAYAILANDGRDVSITFLKQTQPKIHQQQIVPSQVAQAVNKMLQWSLTSEGSGHRAQVPGYLVAGKTGTVKKVNENGYADNSHLAVFAGFAPADDPEVVVVVMIDDPKSGDYYGGLVAAPVFSRIMSSTLHYLDIPPQPFDQNQLLLAQS